MGLDTREVLEAAGTKWNFLKFTPGLVGGHCIGVDPFYLTHKAEMLGYHPHVILAGRRINDGMGGHIARQTVRHMIKKGVQINGAKVLVLGLTFKENCPDIRNSKVIDIINELKTYHCDIDIHDPWADALEVEQEFIDFCQNAPEVDEDMNSPYRGRFKAIVRCENFDRFNFPSIVSGYNAKPALIRQTGNLVRGPGNRYIEMDINGHRFNAIAKGALQSILPSFPEVICSFGFCLEGREDSELPEILFGCATWNKPLLEGCVEWNI
jgi:hypothetical protein